MCHLSLSEKLFQQWHFLSNVKKTIKKINKEEKGKQRSGFQCNLVRISFVHIWIE